MGRETYQEFLDRINSFEKKKINYGKKYFNGNPSISQKVDKNNTFKKFYGDTMVFALEDIIKNKLAEYVELLYDCASECFCERLSTDTFHVTLHDLSSASILRDVTDEMSGNEIKVIGKIAEIQKHEKAKIKMYSNYIFNMVDTSLVLGLYPADADGYDRLMELYSIFDNIKQLDYPYTPHITLAYYNVNGFDLHAAMRLQNTVNQLNKNKIEIELSVNNLFYQKFNSMNDYIDILNPGRESPGFTI